MTDGINHEELNVWAKGQSPVFVLGPERSGTSMMFRALVSHSSFCKFGNATVETFAFVHPERLLAKPSPDNYEVRLYLGDKYDMFLRAVKRLTETNRKESSTDLPSSYIGDKKIDNVVWTKNQYADILRIFFYYSWLNLGKKRLAEKTPAHVRHLDHIFECFPNAKVLACLRDPIEIVASHRKRLENELSLGKDKNDSSLGWLKKSVDEYFGYFSFIEKKLKDAERRSGNIKRVSYSQITQQPDYLASVFDFLDEGIEATNRNTSVSNDRSLDWDPLLSSSPQTNTIDINQYLSNSELARCKKVASDVKLYWS